KCYELRRKKCIKKGVGMKIIQIQMLLFIIFFSTINANQTVAPYFYVRSQGRNAARDYAGWTDYINLPCEKDKIYGALAITPEYTHSFRPSHITVPLFGDKLHGCKKSQLKISGTQTNNRSPQD